MKKFLLLIYLLMMPVILFSGCGSTKSSGNFVEGWENLNIKNEPVEYNGQKFNRVLVIGDIHGQFTRFMSMYNKLNVTDSDLVIFVGDYIKGEKVGEDLKTVEWLMEQNEKKNVILLSGNMEREVLQECFDENGNLKENFKEKWSVSQELKDANDQQLTKKVYDFFSNLKFYQTLKIGDREFIFCHAGIKEGVPLDKQDEFSLMFNKNFNEEYNGEQFVVIGHRPVQVAYDKKVTVPIKVEGRNILMTDTRCKAEHGYSSCINILTGEFWQSEKDW